MWVFPVLYTTSIGHTGDDASFVDPFCYLCFTSLQACDHLLGKGWSLGDVSSCFCHFPIWCPGTVVILDCIDP